MTKKKTTMYIDEDLLRQTKVYAARKGSSDSDVIEQALRRFLGIDVLEKVWARSDLTGDEAMKLATEAVREARREA